MRMEKWAKMHKKFTQSTQKPDKVLAFQSHKLRRARQGVRKEEER